MSAQPPPPGGNEKGRGKGRPPKINSSAPYQKPKHTIAESQLVARKRQELKQTLDAIIGAYKMATVAPEEHRRETGRVRYEHLMDSYRQKLEQYEDMILDYKKIGKMDDEEMALEADAWRDLSNELLRNAESERTQHAELAEAIHNEANTMKNYADYLIGTEISQELAAEMHGRPSILSTMHFKRWIPAADGPSSPSPFRQDLSVARQTVRESLGAASPEARNPTMVMLEVPQGSTLAQPDVATHVDPARPSGSLSPESMLALMAPTPKPSRKPLPAVASPGDSRTSFLLEPPRPHQSLLLGPPSMPPVAANPDNLRASGRTPAPDLGTTKNTYPRSYSQHLAYGRLGSTHQNPYTQTHADEPYNVFADDIPMVDIKQIMAERRGDGSEQMQRLTEEFGEEIRKERELARIAREEAKKFAAENARLSEELLDAKRKSNAESLQLKQQAEAEKERELAEKDRIERERSQDKHEVFRKTLNTETAKHQKQYDRLADELRQRDVMLRMHEKLVEEMRQRIAQSDREIDELTRKSTVTDDIRSQVARLREEKDKLTSDIASMQFSHSVNVQKRDETLASLHKQMAKMGDDYKEKYDALLRESHNSHQRYELEVGQLQHVIARLRQEKGAIARKFINVETPKKDLKQLTTKATEIDQLLLTAEKYQRDAETSMTPIRVSRPPPAAAAAPPAAVLRPLPAEGLSSAKPAAKPEVERQLFDDTPVAAPKTIISDYNIMSKKGGITGNQLDANAYPERREALNKEIAQSGKRITAVDAIDAVLKEEYGDRNINKNYFKNPSSSMANSAFFANDVSRMSKALDKMFDGSKLKFKDKVNVDVLDIDKKLSLVLNRKGIFD